MTGLEIALFILGAAFIIISFFIVDNSSRYTRNHQASDSTVTGEAIRRIGADAIEDMNRRSDMLIAESEDKLESISNDKIIAVGEYSDQVLEKINSNHKEVVFLYQMLNDKEDELKETVTKLENMRIECEKLIKAEAAEKAKSAAGTAGDSSAVNRIRTIPVQAPQVTRMPQTTQDTQIKISGTTQGAQVAQMTQTSQMPQESQISQESPATVSQAPGRAPEELPEKTKNTAGTATGKAPDQNNTTQAKTRTAAPGPKPGTRKSAASTAKNTVKKTTQPPVSAPIEAEGRDNQSLSRNEEIITLHRQGKSVMEISKLLGMGQGEVRLIINLYG